MFANEHRTVNDRERAGVISTQAFAATLAFFFARVAFALVLRGVTLRGRLRTTAFFLLPAVAAAGFF